MDPMRLPPTDGIRVRLVHGGAYLASLPLRWRYGPPIEPGHVVEPEPFFVPLPGGAMGTYQWGPVSVDRAATLGNPGPVVLVHGLNANACYYAGVASLLGKTRRVLACDQRRHGTTGPLPGGVDLADTRLDLERWLDALRLGQVDLVGHSWGGKVCLDFASAHPERVRRLVLVDPVPPQGLHLVIRHSGFVAAAIFSPERGPFATEAALVAAVRRISWLRHAAPWAIRAFRKSFHSEPTADHMGRVALRPVLDTRSFDTLYHEVLSRPSPLPLHRVRCPVLLVRASFSAMPFPGEVAWLRRRIPTLRHLRVPGEHSLHMVNPSGLALVTERFLSEK